MTEKRRLAFRHYSALALFVCLLLSPGRASLPPIDRDEPRYMQATAQMLKTGNFIDVRFQDQPRYLQPAGIYWLEAASATLFGTPGAREPFVFRLPSLAGAVAATLLTAWIGSMLFGATAGLVAGLLLGVSVLLGFGSRLATIDATLLPVILLAQAALLRIYLAHGPFARRDPLLAPTDAGPPHSEPVSLRGADGGGAARGTALLFWVALGVGLMLKGPVILLVAGGTVLGLLLADRRAGWLRHLHARWGVLVMLAIVLPWCIGIAVVSGGAFFTNAIGTNFLGKVASGQQAHGLPPGYYLVAFGVTFWPGTLFAMPAVPFAWARRRTVEMRFLLAWILPTWLVFELVQTKLPHYVLPTYPAIACVIAAALILGAQSTRPVWIWLTRANTVLWLLVALSVVLAGPILLWRLEGRFAPLPVLLGVAVLALCAVTLRFVARHRPEGAVACAAVAALVLQFDVFGLVLPQLHTVWLSPRIASTVAAVRPCPDSVVASASFSEPSLVFLLGQQTRLINPLQSADFLLAEPRCNLVLIDQHQQSEFLGRLAAAHVTPLALAEVKGLNYSTGKWLDLMLYGGPKEHP
jgi:4-amino-4-deoxy-L-arabinose transferase-like glycosyltransferase